MVFPLALLPQNALHSHACAVSYSVNSSSLVASNQQRLSGVSCNGRVFRVHGNQPPPTAAVAAIVLLYVRNVRPLAGHSALHVTVPQAVRGSPEGRGERRRRDESVRGEGSSGRSMCRAQTLSTDFCCLSSMSFLPQAELTALCRFRGCCPGTTAPMKNLRGLKVSRGRKCCC